MPSSMNEHGSNLSKPSFGCYFHCNCINLKRLMIVFGNTCVIYDLWKGCRSAVSDSEQKWFVICDPKSLNSIPVVPCIKIAVVESLGVNLQC